MSLIVLQPCYRLCHTDVEHNIFALYNKVRFFYIRPNVPQTRILPWHVGSLADNNSNIQHSILREAHRWIFGSLSEGTKIRLYRIVFVELGRILHRNTT